MNKAEKILLALRHFINVKDYKDLADAIGVKRTMIYSWVKNGSITQTGKILAKFPYIRLEWLETGEGPMFTDDQHDQPPLKQVLQAVDLVYDLKEDDDQKEPVDIEEMVKMTRTILESKTVYKSALASNVRAFYKAVNDEGEMDSMREELRETNRRMASLEEKIELLILMQTGASQKRETGS